MSRRLIPTQRRIKAVARIKFMRAGKMRRKGAKYRWSLQNTMVVDGS
jgi:hypothetical protein